MIAKRLLVCLVVATGIGLSDAGDARAQAYPNHALKIVVPYPPGGPTDVLARLVAEKLSSMFAQSVIVESRPGGAGGTVGAKAVASADPDGYTLLISQVGALTISPSIYKSVDYELAKAFAPVALVAVSPQLLCVSPTLPVKSMAELLAYAKANPGKVNFGSAGAGTASHITGEYFAASAGITLVHIPYKGTGPALTDLLGGHIPMAFAPIPASHPNVTAGKLRALAVTSTIRSSLMPDVPTMAEAGLPGFDASLYYGLAAPAGTPKPVIDKLNKALREALASDEVKRQLGADGTEITPGTPEDYAELIDKDEKKWSQLLKASGVAPE